MSQHISALVTVAQQLNTTIWKYVLEPQQVIGYLAGQYLQIHTANNTHYYSIANAPSEGPYYELHIRHLQDEDPWVVGQFLDISLPYGHCHLDQLQTDKPILFLAAGTGFAPIRAMIEDLSHHADSRRLELYWGVANADDLYDQASVQHWQQTLPAFAYFPHIAQSHQPGLLSRVLAQHPQDLQDWQVVMAGPFEYMYHMRDALLRHGLLASSIVSDAFEFEPR